MYWKPSIGVSIDICCVSLYVRKELAPILASSEELVLIWGTLSNSSFTHKKDGKSKLLFYVNTFLC